MKKREVVIVVLLISFGLVYHAIQKGKLNLIDDFSMAYDETRLVSNQFVEIFQDEKVFSAGQKISIQNPAGEIVINKSSDAQIHLLSAYKIYFLDKRDVEKISKDVLVRAELENSELKIFAAYPSPFPYRQVRIRFQLLVPEGMALDVRNQQGNITIARVGKNIFIDQENGDVLLESIPSSVQVEIRRGNLDIKNVSEKLAITANQSDMLLENISSLRLVSRNGDCVIKKIKGHGYIEHTYGELNLDGAGQLEIKGRHSKMTVRNVADGISLSNSFENIFLENIAGDVKLSCRLSKIDIRHGIAKNTVIENSFANVDLTDYSGEVFNFLIKNGNLNLQLKQITESMNIESRNAKINLMLGALTDPTFSIKTRQGRIYNKLSLAMDMYQENVESFATRSGQKPEIIINNIYGDIILQH